MRRYSSGWQRAIIERHFIDRSVEIAKFAILSGMNTTVAVTELHVAGVIVDLSGTDHARNFSAIDIENEIAVCAHGIAVQDSDDVIDLPDLNIRLYEHRGIAGRTKRSAGAVGNVANH